MTGAIFLVVNADDLGQSEGVNRGIAEAHERGIVTSASLMVRWPAVGEAAAYSRVHADLAVGLHLDLGEWAFRDGEWRRLYDVVPEEDASAVADEIERQLDAFRELMGRDPTHLDSHQHVHRRGPARKIVTGVARDLNVPLRHVTPGIRYRGDFYGQSDTGETYPDGISVHTLIRLLESLPPGVTELGCHPGYADDLDTMYRVERALEVQTLCDPRVRSALDSLGIQLCSFADSAVRAAAGAKPAP